MDSIDQILIIDDDLAIHPSLTQGLHERGFHVETAVDAEQALRVLDHQAFDIAILNLNLTGSLSSQALFQAIQARSPETITIWTGDLPLDSALPMLPDGTSDYLVKPTDLDELVQVIQRNLLLRQRQVQQDGNMGPSDAPLAETTASSLATPPSESLLIKVGDLEIDPLKSTVQRNHEPLSLSPSEFSTLNYLVSHARRTVTAEELAKATDSGGQLDGDTHTMVRAKIKRLRRKLGDDARNPRYILNVRGKGYRFEP